MERKQEMLEELCGESLDEFNATTGIAKINGQRAYILDPSRELTIRHELIAEFAAAGMKPADIARHLKTNPEKTDAGHYGRLLRDPRIKALAKSKVADTVGEAQATLKKSLVKAAENITGAVEKGDLKMSQYLLDTQGVSQKATGGNTTVNMDFGKWLSSYQDTKSIHEIPANHEEAQVVVTDVSALPSKPEGERL